MKFKYCGIVLLAFFLGAYTMPADVEPSNAGGTQGIPLEIANAQISNQPPIVTPVNDKEFLMHNKTTFMIINFPQNVENTGIKENNDVELVMMPRVSEPLLKQPNESKGVENIQQIQILSDLFKPVNEKNEKEEVEPLPSEIVAVQVQAPQADEPPQISISQEGLDTVPTFELAGASKPLVEWNFLEQNKNQLLEERLPDLTPEELQEIKSADAIPLHYLKRIREPTKPQDDKTELSALENGKPGSDSLPETPVFITIPIVINHRSSLPISLNIGGSQIPLSKPFKATTKPDEAPLDVASSAIRETNRYRGNVRSKIFARSGPHEVFAYGI